MHSTTPQIGFDRFIRLEWAEKALEVRAALADISELDALLDETHSGPAARKKTRTVLNRLWLKPREDMVSFAQRGVDLFQSTPSTSPAALTWGMAIVAYPFFAKVAEIVGRLTTLQGDCTNAEVHRRMAEIYGEREGTRRMTNMVLQSFNDWQIIVRSQKRKTISRADPILIENQELASLLVEACLLNACHPISVSALEGYAQLFPFQIAVSLPYILSQSDNFELLSDNLGSQIVMVHV